MSVAPFQKPSPDWDMVTLVWAGTYLDGTPATGTIEIQYEGAGPMLDDDPAFPLSIFSAKVSIPIASTTLLIGGESRTVGYVSVSVPASNDPDIQGGGGTYRFSEVLTRGGGRLDVSFVADKDTPGGVIHLNKVPAAQSTPGEPVTVVYYADFTALKSRVDTLEAEDPGAGLPTQSGHAGHVLTTDGTAAAWETIAATDISDSTAVGRSILTASTATAARTALGLAAVATTGDASDLSGDPLPDALLPDAATAGMKWNGATFVAGRVTLFTGGSDAVPPTGLAAGDVWIREVP